jgi:hypothetical protein
MLDKGKINNSRRLLYLLCDVLKSGRYLPTFRKNLLSRFQGRREGGTFSESGKKINLIPKSDLVRRL